MNTNVPKRQIRCYFYNLLKIRSWPLAFSKPSFYVSLYKHVFYMKSKYIQNLANDLCVLPYYLGTNGPHHESGNDKQMRDARIQRGPPPPLKITKNIGFFLAILVRIPCKFTKLPSNHSILGLHRPARETLCHRPAFSAIWHWWALS